MCVGRALGIKRATTEQGEERKAAGDSTEAPAPGLFQLLLVGPPPVDDGPSLSLEAQAQCGTEVGAVLAPPQLRIAAQLGEAPADGAEGQGVGQVEEQQHAPQGPRGQQHQREGGRLRVALLAGGVVSVPELLRHGGVARDQRRRRDQLSQLSRLLGVWILRLLLPLRVGQFLLLLAVAAS